jgi:hypothetical protein
MMDVSTQIHATTINRENLPPFIHHEAITTIVLSRDEFLELQGDLEAYTDEYKGNPTTRLLVEILAKKD